MICTARIQYPCPFLLLSWATPYLLNLGHAGSRTQIARIKILSASYYTTKPLYLQLSQASNVFYHPNVFDHYPSIIDVAVKQVSVFVISTHSLRPSVLLIMTLFTPHVIIAGKLLWCGRVPNRQISFWFADLLVGGCHFLFFIDANKACPSLINHSLLSSAS